MRSLRIGKGSLILLELVFVASIVGSLVVGTRTALSLPLDGIIDREMATSSARLVVVAPTFYSDTSEIRYRLALEACRRAAQHEIELFLVDASPSPDIRLKFEMAGRRPSDGVSFVTVTPQSSRGGKGAALREGISRALDRLREKDLSSSTMLYIGFQELEKVDLFQHWKSIVLHASKEDALVVVPRREDRQFREYYPIEQYHSEQFANGFLDSLGKTIGIPSIDWTNGPVAFEVSLVDQWLNYDGEIWDAQLVPIVDSFVHHKAKIVSFEIP